jgi:hypothetical protein
MEKLLFALSFGFLLVILLMQQSFGAGRYDATVSHPPHTVPD